MSQISIQRLFQFSEDDLQANREGKVTPQQRNRLIGRFRFYGPVGVVFTIFLVGIFVLLINLFFSSEMSVETPLWLVAMLVLMVFVPLGIALVMITGYTVRFFRAWYMLRKGNVLTIESVTGRPQHREESPVVNTIIALGNLLILFKLIMGNPDVFNEKFSQRRVKIQNITFYFGQGDHEAAKWTAFQYKKTYTVYYLPGMATILSIFEHGEDK